jgi:hypothetical protein
LRRSKIEKSPKLTKLAMEADDGKEPEIDNIDDRG